MQHLKLYKDGKPQRNAKGQIVSTAAYQSQVIPTARVEPNRKWFTNTRVISQDSLTAFRSAIADRASDPYHILLRSNKLRLSLIRDDKGISLKEHRAKSVVQSSPFSSTFGPKSQRKRVQLSASSLADLAEDVGKSLKSHMERQDEAKLVSRRSAEEQEDLAATAVGPIFSKG